MSKYVYEGPSAVLWFVGRPGVALHRGVPTELVGAAAVKAARHPEVREVDGDNGPDADLKVVEPTAAQVRAWARSQDPPIEVPDRGSLKPELYEQYKAAHSG